MVAVTESTSTASAAESSWLEELVRLRSEASASSKLGMTTEATRWKALSSTRRRPMAVARTLGSAREAFSVGVSQTPSGETWPSIAARLTMKADSSKAVSPPPRVKLAIRTGLSDAPGT